VFACDDDSAAWAKFGLPSRLLGAFDPRASSSYGDAAAACPPSPTFWSAGSRPAARGLLNDARTRDSGAPRRLARLVSYVQPGSRSSFRVDSTRFLLWAAAVAWRWRALGPHQPLGRYAREASACRWIRWSRAGTLVRGRRHDRPVPAAAAPAALLLLDEAYNQSTRGRRFACGVLRPA
jgi:hypothetical protein